MRGLSSQADLLGYRLWRLGFDQRGPCLWSVVTRHRWDGPVVGPAAIDAPGGPWTPHRQGLYAFSDAESARARRAGGLITGAVRLWGRVAVHEHGYRAECAQILSLATPV